MPEHRIRLRGGWECHYREGDGRAGPGDPRGGVDLRPPRRADLAGRASAWPVSSDGPRSIPRTRPSGPRDAQRRGPQVGPAQRSAIGRPPRLPTTASIDLPDDLLPRNGLVLEVESWARTGSRPHLPGGTIALVIRPPTDGARCLARDRGRSRYDGRVVTDDRELTAHGHRDPWTHDTEELRECRCRSYRAVLVRLRALTAPDLALGAASASLTVPAPVRRRSAQLGGLARDRCPFELPISTAFRTWARLLAMLSAWRPRGPTTGWQRRAGLLLVHGDRRRGALGPARRGTSGLRRRADAARLAPGRLRMALGWSRFSCSRAWPPTSPPLRGRPARRSRQGRPFDRDDRRGRLVRLLPLPDRLERPWPLADHATADDARPCSLMLVDELI